MARKFKIIIIDVAIIKYKPMLVKDICILANKSAFKLNKSLITNWSNGLTNHSIEDNLK